MRSESSNYKLGRLDKDCLFWNLCWNRPTNPDTGSKMVRRQTIKISRFIWAKCHIKLNHAIYIISFILNHDFLYSKFISVRVYPYQILRIWTTSKVRLHLCVYKDLQLSQLYVFGVKLVWTKCTKKQYRKLSCGIARCDIFLWHRENLVMNIDYCKKNKQYAEVSYEKDVLFVSHLSEYSC